MASSAPPTSMQEASSTPSREKGTLQNDPARTGFDPQTSFWVSYFKHLTGQMTAEGSYHFREDVYRRREADDVARCERDRDWLLQYSPTVRFLSDRIAALGGKLDASNIRCQRCPTLLAPDGTVHRRGGGFNPHIGILICANEMRDRRHLEDTLAHEMVHAWDHLRWKVDFEGERDLRQAACTEIRAAMLSGECRWTREFFTRHNWRLSQQFQHCVRMRAIMSVSHRLKCKDDVQATKVVNEVWDSCYADTRPFEEVYR